MSATNGEGDRRAEGILFLVNLLKFESDTATSKNIAIIRLYCCKNVDCYQSLYFGLKFGQNYVLYFRFLIGVQFYNFQEIRMKGTTYHSLWAK